MWRDFIYFYRISRPMNVLVSVLAFGLACYLTHGHSLRFLTDVPFWAAAFTITVIAATGYWINDVHDFRIDRINKPRRTVVNAHLSVKKVLTLYFGLTGGVLLFSMLYFGFYLGKPNVSFINFLSVFLLFIYAGYLKRVGVAGNLTIAFLIALVLFLSYYLYGMVRMSLIWSIVFAFQITLIREVTKDVEDIRGDLAYHLRTLPIQIGVRATQKVLAGLYVLFIVSTYLPLASRWLSHGQWIWMYWLLSLVLVQTPMLLLLRYMWRNEKPEAFGAQSRYLKWLMLTGMLTLLFLP